VIGKVGREDVIAIRDGRTELLEHVGGLPAAVKAQHRRELAMPPFQVMHLPSLDHGEAAATPSRHVVPRGQGVLHGLVDGVDRVSVDRVSIASRS